jgi:hypothetical protein
MIFSRVLLPEARWKVMQIAVPKPFQSGSMPEKVGGNAFAIA